MTIVDTARRTVARAGVPLLRLSLGLVFVWFGALKVADRTPVGDLVAGTVPWLDATWFVPALGAFEVALGLALIAGYRLGWVALLMAGHLAGTFLTFVMQPAVAFIQGNPLLLTTEGEFVAKNLVLATAALVVAASAGRRDRDHADGAEADGDGQGGGSDPQRPLTAADRRQ
jgi:putative oxidoreductase